MRVDAERNRDRLLTVAREIIVRQGAEASLRDIARQAGVGLATLLRHFPTRETLLEALLWERLDQLTREAGELEASSPDEALVTWFRHGVAFVRTYSGIVDLMAAAIGDPKSALHASCTAVRAAGARLLLRAQSEGRARADIDGVGLFALMGALGWISDQPTFAPQADHLTDVIVEMLLTGP